MEPLSKLGHEPNVVVLINAYDAPIVNLKKGSELEQANIKVMKEQDTIRSALANKKIKTFIGSINTAFATLPYYTYY